MPDAPSKTDGDRHPIGGRLSSFRSTLEPIVGFGVPFLLIAYLALEAGGYDLVLRSQVAIVVWWAILLGAAVGVLPLLRLTRFGLFALMTLAALALWAGLATIVWTDSRESSMVEVSRLVALLGLLALLLLVQGHKGLRRSLGGLAAALTLVAFVALTDRFLPDLVSSDYMSELPAAYPRARLAYPLEYWNGLAALMAIGLAPLLWASAMGLTRLGRALAAGSIPLVILVLFMTASRGGIAAALVGLVALLVVFPKRIWLIVASLPSIAGAVVLIQALNARPEVRDFIDMGLMASQGKEMVAACLIVFGLTAVIRHAITWLVDRDAIPVPRISYRATQRTGIGLGITVILLFIVGLASGFLGDKWNEFKQPAADGTTVDRLDQLSSGERYLLWDSALEAFSSKVPLGLGPGTFEYWWAEEGEGVEFVRDAHSLYLETLAEMGPVGLLLVSAFIFGPIAVALLLLLRQGSIERRSQIAAATSGMAAFALAAGLDWAWEMTVLPAAFLVLMAAVLGPDAEIKVLQEVDNTPNSGLSVVQKGAVVLVSFTAITIIALPLVGTGLVRSSQSLAATKQLNEALERAELASRVQPYAASSKIQEAQLLLALGQDYRASEKAQQAVDAEPGNWRNWFVLSQALARISAERSQRASVQARALNRRAEAFRQREGTPGDQGR